MLSRRERLRNSPIRGQKLTENRGAQFRRSPQPMHHWLIEFIWKSPVKFDLACLAWHNDQRHHPLGRDHSYYR